MSLFGGEQPDPLEEAPPAKAEGCAHGCVDGWVQVREKYAEHMADQRHGAENRETQAWRSAYAANLNSAYPCRVHRPVQFFRWAGGHYEKDHDPGTCPDCIEAHGGARKARRFAAMARGNDQTERVRRDLDS